MELRDALLGAGLSPPQNLSPGRWIRFPGIGKGRGNTSGWCRILSPGLAVYGDWSQDLRAVWRDESVQDGRSDREALRDALREQKAERTKERVRQREVAKYAQRLVERAVRATHPYLERKGFPSYCGLVDGHELLVPMRDVRSYDDVLNVQRISSDGTKKFLLGGRARGAVYIMGPHCERTVLVEGFATGLSVELAVQRLGQPARVVVCFSAHNLAQVAKFFPAAVVAADHDESGTGEAVARETALKWVMPDSIGDFNDQHLKSGIWSVTQKLRELFV